MLDLTDWERKKYQTMGGRPVRILCIDAPGENPIVGYLLYDDGDSMACSWMSDGTFTKRELENRLNLCNAKTKRDGWVNIYPDNLTSRIYTAREDADRCAGSDRTACIHIEWEE